MWLNQEEPRSIGLTKVVAKSASVGLACILIGHHHLTQKSEKKKKIAKVYNLRINVKYFQSEQFVTEFSKNAKTSPVSNDLLAEPVSIRET
jgi:hypothetical protein